MIKWLLLEEAVEKDVINEPLWTVLMALLIILCVAPWIFVIFRYGIFRKLRVRFILPNNEELPPLYLKKNAEIILPEPKEYLGYKFCGWYLDSEFEYEYIPMPMPDKNLKLYGKYEKINFEEEELPQK